MMKPDKRGGMDETSTANQLFGIALVMCNLALDGFTNASQEDMFKANKKISPFHMMLFLNLWTFALLAGLRMQVHSLTPALCSPSVTQTVSTASPMPPTAKQRPSVLRSSKAARRPMSPLAWSCGATP